jgi:hypothetical protein
MKILDNPRADRNAKVPVGDPHRALAEIPHLAALRAHVR